MCNQHVNSRQQNYRPVPDICIPSTWYYQSDVSPENYGYFQPTQPQASPIGYQSTVLPETHRALALPLAATQAPTQTRQQNVHSIHANISPNKEETTPTNQT